MKINEISVGVDPEEIARQEIRNVAAAMLAEGYTSDYVRAVGSEENGTAKSFREFADAMDELQTPT